MRVLISGLDAYPLYGLHAAFKLNGIVSLDCQLDEVLQSLRLDAVDALVINPHAERGAGIEVVNRLRAGRLTTAVLLHGVQAPVADVVKWMEVSDDCLHGLCDPREVVAKLRAIVRRMHGQASGQTTIGPVTLDMPGQRVLVHDRPVHLTRTEMLFLEFLMIRAGRCCPKGAILDHLYGGLDQPDQKIIDVFLCKIRRKLAVAGAPQDFVQTVWGRGYMIAKPIAAARKLAA